MWGREEEENEEEKEGVGEKEWESKESSVNEAWMEREIGLGMWDAYLIAGKM